MFDSETTKLLLKADECEDRENESRDVENFEHFLPQMIIKRRHVFVSSSFQLLEFQI
jgi:hypothetical protein